MRSCWKHDTFARASVYVFGTLFTISSSSPIDLTVFENEVLPRWIKGFQIVDADGKPIEGAFRDSTDKVSCALCIFMCHFDEFTPLSNHPYSYLQHYSHIKRHMGLRT
jgi:hypothetical protein